MIRAHDQRIKAITELLKLETIISKKAEALLDAWSPLRSELHSANLVRDKIAHATITSRGDGTDPDVFLYIYLEPLPLAEAIPVVTQAKERQLKGETPAFIVPPPKAHGLQDILESTRNFNQLFSKVNRFNVQVGDLRETYHEEQRTGRCVNLRGRK